jgi:hypothetical protein
LIEAPKDITKAVRKLGSDEQFRTMESWLIALEAKVARLALALEDDSRKGKGKGPLLPLGWSDDSNPGSSDDEGGAQGGSNCDAGGEEVGEVGGEEVGDSAMAETS